MSDDETITLTDLARLAGVGRNAVSNWRRREGDFPAPVDDNARRPRFALADIEAWAAEHGRGLDVTGADRLWFSLQHTAPEQALERIAAAMDGEGDRALAKRLNELTAETPPADLFEFFVERAREAAGTGTAPGIRALIEVAAACAPDRSGLAAFDPACDDGDLLTGLVATVPDIDAVGGRDLSATQAAVCERRLRLARPGAEVRVSAGDSLLDPLGPERYDLVVCDPPFSVRDWGHERLNAGDARSAFGTPPRTEPELAWALHCLALLTDDGVAVVRMPAQAAHRRSGRRLRSELLRWGALRAVVDHPEAKAHIWILTQRSESSRLLVSTGPGLAEAWRSLRANPDADPTTVETRAIPLMRLWDEDVDVSPAIYLGANETDADQLGVRVERLGGHLEAARNALPDFAAGSASPAPESSLADLEREGAVAIHSGSTDRSEATGIIVDPLGAQLIRIGRISAIDETQWAVTCEDEVLDTAWLATVLTARLPKASRRTATGAKRRLLAVKVPRPSIEEQRRRGAAFAEVLRLRDELDAAGAEAEALTDDAAAGLTAGTITSK